MLERADFEYVRRHLSLGNLVLFTGAGFSHGCVNKVGKPLPLGRELREVIWPHAFPGQPFDAAESLGDIFEVAQRQDRSGLKVTLTEALTIDGASVPAWYRPYMYGPWFRVYTLNFDNFWDLAPQLDEKARMLTPVSALSDETLPPDTTAAVIHLNGRLVDYPNVTFSARQYGERQTTPEKWYVQLTSDLFGHPILFIGTALNEPSFWEYLAMRRQKSRTHGEKRPKSYLIAPELGPAKRQLLKELNIVFVEGDAERFSAKGLDPLAAEVDAGRELLTKRRSATRSDRIIEDVAVLRSAPPPPLYQATDFLLGRQPVWQDIESGHAVTRDFDHDLAAAIDARLTPVIVVTGTAGTGKSTSLMRAALALSHDGRRVLWFDGKEETELRPWQLRKRTQEADAEYFFVDDADAFGPVAGQFLTEVAADNLKLTVIAAVRANRLRYSGMEHDSLDATELVVPGLADPDIDLLIGALDDANRLGFLKGKTQDQRVAVFRRSFDRQLLVAMMEATSGERFDELIKGECAELEGLAYDLYAMTCFVTALGSGVKRDELLLALNCDTPSAVAALQHLLDRHLLVTDAGGLIRARHRVIAEHAIDHIKTSGYFPRVIAGLVFALATKISPLHGIRSREHRLLVKLISHDYLLAQVGDPQQIRPIYSEVEEILKWDFHYWLQRGSFEVERGSISYARNFLAQAKSLAPDDLFVRTEWGYMLMVEATGQAQAALPQHRDSADEAFAELYDVIETNGHRTPYPYHVLATQGMEWLGHASLTAIDRAKYLGEILFYVRQGMKRHHKSNELRTVEKAVEKAYLLTSVTKT